MDETEQDDLCPAGPKAPTTPPSQRRLVGYLLLTAVLLFFMEMALEHLVPGAKEALEYERMFRWLQANRSWAWAAILAFWLIQAVLAPLPAFVLTMATALLYGETVTGILFAFLLTWGGAMLGAVVCFGLARKLGRDWVMRRGYLDSMQDLDAYLEEKGAQVIFLSRLIPIVSFDIVSYAAGLTRIKWRDFCVSTGLGMIPPTLLFILFAYFALNQDMTFLVVISILGLIMLAIASYLLVWLMNDYEQWKKDRG